MSAHARFEFVVHREKRSEGDWVDLASITVGDPCEKSDDADAYILVMEAGSPVARIDVNLPDEEYHFKLKATEWAGWIVVGFGARIVMLHLDSSPQRVISLSERQPAFFCDYFQRFVSSTDYLLVCSGTRVFRIGRDAEVIWKSEEVGLDGVNVHNIEADVIDGSGQCDPPDGWRDFALSLSTGLKIADAQPPSDARRETAGDARRFEFDLTQADWAALVQSRGRWDQRSLWMLKVAAVMVGMGWAWLQTEKPPSNAALALLVLLIPGLLAIGFFALKISDWRKVQRWRPPSTPTEVVSRDDNLRVTENDVARNYARADFTKIEMKAEHIFMTASPEDVVILPLRAFESESDMRKFYRSWAEVAPPPGAQQHKGTEPLPEDSISVVTALTPDDARALQASFAATGRISLPKAAIYVALLGGAITAGLSPLWTLFTHEPLDWFQSAAFAWPGAVIAIWLGARRMDAGSQQDWSMGDRRRDPVNVEIDANGLDRRGDGFHTHIAWEAVKEIRETADHILFVTPWEEVTVVPKRCFDSAASISKFVSSAESWREAACAGASSSRRK